MTVVADVFREYRLKKLVTMAIKGSGSWTSSRNFPESLVGLY